MTPSCLSELKIDRMIAGELAAADDALARRHAAGCAECGELVRHAEATARRFAEQRPPLALPGRRRGRAALAIASAAFAVAMVGLAFRAPREQLPGVRTKGRAALGFYVSHAGQLRRGQSGEVVAPGDRLQLVTTSERAGWIAVTGVDALAVRQVYAAPQALAAGRDRALPFSIILDTTPGPATITAVFCAEPFSLDRPAAGCSEDAFTIETRDEAAGSR